MSAGVWTNWAREQRCAPLERAAPRSEDELAATVARAQQRGLVVRAVGAGHSFTDAVCTDGVLVDLSHMPPVVDADPATGVVTVAAGLRLRDLGPQLAAHGLALENQGDIDAQTVAGALATGTHGTGARLGNLSSRVVGMRLVTGGGDTADLTGDDLRAARVAVGALGIATTVTVRCVPQYTLRRHDRPRSLDDALATLDADVDGHDHYEMFAFPYTRRVGARAMTRVPGAPQRPTPAWRRRLAEDALENGGLGLLCRAGRRMPRAAPLVQKTFAGALGERRVEDFAHRVYATPRRVRFTEMEYAIAREHVPAALERILDLVERRRLPILFPVEVRFTAPDDAHLSTAFGRATGYLAVHQYAGMEFEGYFRAVEAIMDDYDGRPHWGKRHYQTAAVLRERYPAWDAFQAVRARLDPAGTFTNDYVLRTLGPVSTTVRSRPAPLAS